MSIIASAPDSWAAWLKYLNSLDWGTGETKHAASYLAFIRAGSLGIDPSAAGSEVEARIRGAGGKINARDLERQRARGYDYAKREMTGSVAPFTRVVTRPSYSAADLVTRADRAGSFSWDDLSRRSPVDPLAVTPAAYLDHVFRPGEFVVIVTHRKDLGRIYRAGSGDTWVNELKGDEGILYLSNPTNGERILNDDGRMSLRSSANVTEYRHMVIESDRTIPLIWIRAMVQIPLPIVAIYTSGGKSVHILVRVAAKTNVEYLAALDRLRPGLVRLGADPVSLSGVRLTRLPGTMRGPRRQLLLFLDPEASSQPIAQRPERPSSDPVGMVRQAFNADIIATFSPQEWAEEIEKRKNNKQVWGMQYE